MQREEKLKLKTRFAAFITAIIICLTLNPSKAALAETEAGELPERLHFVSAIDSNLSTERLVYEVFKRLGIDVTITLEDMGIGLKGVNAGVYDGICNQGIGLQDSYDQLVAVPGETAVCNFYALTAKDDPFTCESWDDLRGKRVGTLSDKPYVVDSLPKEIVSHIESVSMTLLYNALLSGECDVIVIPDTSGKSEDQLVIPSTVKLAGRVDTLSCGIFLNKKYAALAGRVAVVLREMEADGSLARIKAMKPIKERDEKVVLYLSSYSAEMQWEQSLLLGIGNVLNLESDIKFLSKHQCGASGNHCASFHFCGFSSFPARCCDRIGQRGNEFFIE